MQFVEQMIDAGADVNECDDCTSLLAHACSAGRIEVARLLARRGAELGALACKGTPALHAACRCGDTDCVRLLLRMGATAGFEYE